MSESTRDFIIILIFIINDKYNTSPVDGQINVTLTASKQVLAKEWKRGAVPLYAMPFPFGVVKGMQLNHIYALMFVSAPLC